MSKAQPLKRAPSGYDQRDQQDLREALDERDELALKKDRHVELRNGVAIRLFDTVTGGQVELTVASGALVVTPL